MKRISEYNGFFEEGLLSLKLADRKPASLYAPIAYAMEAGGKRLRPALALMAADALGCDPAKALPAALALELFHNFTLLHDDVMDKSDMRRNRPTVVKKFGENAAILSGDTMLGLAEQQLLAYDGDCLRRLLAAFNSMSIEVYEGQALDMDFETRSEVSLAEYMEMIRLKTGALLGASAEMGGIIAGADEKVCKALHAYGENLGIAFQIEDDWLDTFGDAATFGKPIGGDIRQGKKTYLLISGLEAGSDESTALRIAMQLPAEDMRVKAVTRIYEKMGLDKAGRAAAAQYSARAMQAVKSTGLDEDKLDSFKYLLDRLTGRKK